MHKTLLSARGMANLARIDSYYFNNNATTNLSNGYGNITAYAISKNCMKAGAANDAKMATSWFNLARIDVAVRSGSLSQSKPCS